jgi:uncharacterized protein YbaP (TraB family)
MKPAWWAWPARATGCAGLGSRVDGADWAAVARRGVVAALLALGALAGAGSASALAEEAAPAQAPIQAPTQAQACPAPVRPLEAAEVQAGMRQAQDHGLLWQLDKGGHRSWLYGTIHAAKLAWMFPGPQVQAALRQAQRVALELDVLDPAIQRQLQQLMSQPGSAAPLPPDLAQRLAAQAKTLCAGDSLAQLRPEVQLALLTLLDLRAEGLEAAYGVDGFLAGLARGLGKRVVSLETPQQQMAALLLPDATERAQAVRQTLEQLEQGRLRRQTLRLAQAWADGDAATLERYPQWCDCLNTPAERAAMHRLLDQRHPGLVRQIVQMHEAGLSVFVAVGSLHLLGPGGLPALLAQRGFTVTPVKLGQLPGAQSVLEPVPSPPGQGDSL